MKLEKAAIAEVTLTQGH